MKKDLLEVLSAILAEVEDKAKEAVDGASKVYKEVQPKVEEVKQKASDIAIETKDKAKDSLAYFMEMLEKLQDDTPKGCCCGEADCKEPAQGIEWNHGAENLSDCVVGLDELDIEATVKYSQKVLKGVVTGTPVTEEPMLIAQMCLVVAMKNREVFAVLFADASEDTTLETINSTSEVAEILYDTFSPVTIAKLLAITLKRDLLY